MIHFQIYIYSNKKWRNDDVCVRSLRACHLHLHRRLVHAQTVRFVHITCYWNNNKHFTLMHNAIIAQNLNRAHSVLKCRDEQQDNTAWASFCFRMDYNTKLKSLASTRGEQKKLTQTNSCTDNIHSFIPLRSTSRALKWKRKWQKRKPRRNEFRV